MKQPSFTEKATSMSNGANLPRISPMTLEAFNIILPPLPLQQHFASLMADTEILRQKQQQSERELEQLFQALLQQYIGCSAAMVSAIEEEPLSRAAEGKAKYGK